MKLTENVICLSLVINSKKKTPHQTILLYSDVVNLKGLSYMLHLCKKNYRGGSRDV